MPKLIRFSDFFQSDKLFGLIGHQFTASKILKLKNKFLYQSYRLFKILAIFIAISFMMNSYVLSNELIDVVESFACGVIMCMTLIRVLYVIHYKRDKIKNVIQKLERHFPLTVHEQKLYGCSGYLGIVKSMCSTTVVLNATLWMHNSLLPFTLQLFALINGESREWEGILKLYYPFDKMEPLAFWTTWIFETWLIFILLFLLGTTDFIFGELSAVVSMELRIVGKQIESIDSGNDDAADELKRLVDIHQELLDIVAEIGKIFSPILFINLLSMVLTMGCCAFVVVRT